MTVKDRLRIHETKLLSDNWYVLKTTAFDWKRRDGTWQTQHREHYDRGNGAVLLTRQFRYPAYVSGYDDLLIEAAAGLLDDAAPEVRIRAEVEEELGYRLGEVRKVFEAFMSPGSVTERLTFFVGAYRASDQVSRGGGEAHEGEDIEVLEPTIDEALAMIADGRIRDAKTIMLLQHLALTVFRA